jgi:polyisoprenoid-binding protein YceI
MPMRYHSGQGAVAVMHRALTVVLTLVMLSVASAQTFDVVAPSEARYLVRERVLGIWMPATVGSTTAVAGTVTFDGPVVVSGSRIDVDAATITSDQAARDAVVRRESLQTDEHRWVTFAPLQVGGLPSPMPTEGRVEITVVGDLTVRGVVRRITWSGTARFEGEVVHLDASTRVTFEALDLPQPRLGALVVLDDEIVLEVALVLARR